MILRYMENILRLLCTTLHYIIKGAMCKMFEYLLTEMQYDIHNYVFSGV